MTAVLFGASRTQPAHRLSQRGQAALLVVMLVGMAAVLLVYGMVDTTSAALRRDKDTAALLAQAKQALIGRAAADQNRPGSLPCPDIDNDGILTLNVDFFPGGVCASLIGRLPWRTLGLPDLRDDAGERLWYALSDLFSDNSAAGLLDSDTKGNRTVYRESSAVTITAEAVAVIFAPGPILPGQLRDTVTNQNTANNYLDSTGGANNAAAAGPYIAAQRSSTFNDKLLVITTADLMPPLERRVAREMLALLQSYRSTSACACYPWAANDFDDDSVIGRTRGMVPMEVAEPHSWASLGINVPTWIANDSPNNKWGGLFYYAIAPSESADHTAGTLTVNGASKNLVLITTGPAGASRPSGTLSNYVDDAENSNGDNVFQTPVSTAYTRDRLYVIP